MKSKEEELKEHFLTEALENQQELDKLFTELEKNHSSKSAIEAIFRITHTLKANAAGIGFSDMAAMAHVLEDVFSAIKSHRLTITATLFNDLFRANDILGSMIEDVRNGGTSKIKYRGIKTKLEVLLTRLNEEESAQKPSKTTPVSPTQVDSPKQTKGVDAAGDQPAYVTAIETDTLELDPEEELEENTQEYRDNKIAFSDHIHIPVRKLDELMNLVGELMIERDRVIAISVEAGRKANEYARLQRITSELQYSVMDVRLVQVDVLFSKFHRIVRDVAALEEKKVNLILEGTQNEIDRNVLQIISDSLIHLVRNAVSHGIETEAERLKVGKATTGAITLSARSEKEEVIIVVSDDGKGIHPEMIRRKAVEKGLVTAPIAKTLSEEEVMQFIFEPGFSSADQVTAISGRGVGMDVVKKAIDSIGGKINVQSKVGKGTSISLVLPSSMAVKKALLFELNTGAFAFPLSYTDAVISIPKRDIHKVGNGLIAKHAKKNISVVFLNDLFSLNDHRSAVKEGAFHQSFNQLPEDTKLFVIVVSYNNREVGFVVDKLLQQKEIVEKPLGPMFEDVKFVSGATILGTGDICLVLDAPSIMGFLFRNSKLVK